MEIKIIYSSIFEGNDGLPILCKKYGWTYKETNEKTGFIGNDAPDTVAYITGPKSYVEFRNILRKENCKPCNLMFN